MLVLSRKLGEQIVLPHCEVTMTVLGVSGNRVRIGVAAPAGTAVHRREVWDKIAAGPVNSASEPLLQGRQTP
jgi:carbon storage regulator